MKWLLLLLLLVIVAVVAARVLLRQAGQTGGPAARRRCVRCHGTGWVGGGQERTLDFDGQGFQDRHTPKTMCDACGGTGSLA
ncbi:hypothetical protein AB0J83_04220 [Actinoplanes sp. NPDC049596]|uniref:hypothetical protein n=1 Tax=unclassified Actinoplanes TaxID=2626549 RepID=UPI0034182203